MEALTRLVSESFARHGFERPLDYRRLHWSRWFPCESPRSLLLVPSKPGIFALAEEVIDFGASPVSVGTAAPGCPAERNLSAGASGTTGKDSLPSTNREALDVSRAAVQERTSAPLAADGIRITDGPHRAETARRMLAVIQFGEADDMAFVLDRMFSRQNPARARLMSGRCFIRYVVVEDNSQRRQICNALNQWLLSSSDMTTGIGAHFATSLELSNDNVARTTSSAIAASAIHTNRAKDGIAASSVAVPPQPKERTNARSPQPFPSGF